MRITKIADHSPQVAILESNSLAVLFLYERPKTIISAHAHKYIDRSANEVKL